jgi:hypothetical protein
MEPEQQNPEVEAETKEGSHGADSSVWTTVTPLSQVLARVLFVVLPFAGFWIGYHYAPDKIVYIQKTSPAGVRADRADNQTSSIQKEIQTQQFESAEAMATTTADLEMTTYGWCMERGGEDITFDYNSQKRCLFDGRIYESPCMSTEKYQVIQAPSYPEFTDILVKPKTSPDEHASCEYVVEEGDYIISVSENSFLFGLAENYLLIDSGTGPGPRGLDVYALDKNGERVYSDTYMRPVSIDGTVIDYWTTTDITASAENCEQFKDWRQGGLGAGIDEKVSIDLATLEFTQFGELRCTARQ